MTQILKREQVIEQMRRSTSGADMIDFLSEHFMLADEDLDPLIEVALPRSAWLSLLDDTDEVRSITHSAPDTDTAYSIIRERLGFS